MKTLLIICASPFVVGLVVSLALANPDMLPKHPGYPMGKSVDPVKGQPLANDPGQKPNIKIEPPVKEATKINASPQ